MHSMGKTLIEIAQQLKDTDKKVQLIYAFNGIGKTRLSLEFKQLIAPETNNDENDGHCTKFIYYNAFTEDLFYWYKDPAEDTEPKLKIQSNSFTKWVLKDQGKDQRVIEIFQHYSNTKVLPKFNENYSEVTFSLPQDYGSIDNIKISKGEESNFVWSIFYSLLEQVVEELVENDPANRSTNIFDELNYVFVDDPVSSLDENHLIELAVNLAGLIKKSSGLKFVISTHSPLFYNILHNELGLNKQGKREGCYLLEKLEDGTFNLNVKYGDSNKNFSYHLFLKNTITEAISQNNIQKYHFTLLRNLYEKTANFLGYPLWSELLPDDKQTYYNRVIQFTSHSTLSNETVPEPTDPEKQTVAFLLKHLINNYSYWQESSENV